MGWIIFWLLCVRACVFFLGIGWGLMLIPKLSRPAGTCGWTEGCMTAELSTFPYCKGSWVQVTGWEAVVLATQGSPVCCSPTEKERKRRFVRAHIRQHRQAFSNDTDHLASTCKTLCTCMWVCVLLNHRWFGSTDWSVLFFCADVHYYISSKSVLLMVLRWLAFGQDLLYKSESENYWSRRKSIM